MTRFIASITTAIALCLSASAGMANDMTKHGDLEISKPWTRATPPKAPTGGGYVTITNTGSEPDRLVAASTDIAGMAEIHEMSMEGGVMKMRPMGEGITIAPGETVVLGPGGLHIMMMKLKGPITKGESVLVRLTFEKAGEVTVQFVAAPIGAKEPPQ
ncbi:MAG TPA: copper chaperone PCu(A)C [Afifellaceae bacterium]|nr:copper chaperone PCu(A)C [Afifellaceae bacterium]